MADKDLVLKGLVKSFDNHTAINDVSLIIPKGKFTVLLGPSGCGKSTLLRMISGLELPTAGNICVGEEKIDQLPASSRNISIPQHPQSIMTSLTESTELQKDIHRLQNWASKWNSMSPNATVCT